MAAPSDYAQARDPRTAPVRLHELALSQPELQPLVMLNPSCPADLAEWIRQTNPTARRVLEERHALAQRQERELTQGHERELAQGYEQQPGIAEWEQTASPHVATEPLAAQAPAAQPPVQVGPMAPHASPHPSAEAPLPSDLFEHPDTGQVERERRRGRFSLVALLGCLVLLISLGIGAYAGSRALLGGGDQGAESTATASGPSQKPSEEQDQTSEASPSQTPSSAPVSPAPDGAKEMPAFISPSGNIACSLEGTTVGCTLKERTYTAEDCPANGPFSISVGEDDAALACGTDFRRDGAATLEYGSAAKNGDVACTSESSGVTCWNTRTGRGFFVSKSTYRTI